MNKVWQVAAASPFFFVGLSCYLPLLNLYHYLDHALNIRGRFPHVQDGAVYQELGAYFHGISHRASTRSCLTRVPCSWDSSEANIGADTYLSWRHGTTLLDYHTYLSTHLVVFGRCTWCSSLTIIMTESVQYEAAPTLEPQDKPSTWATAYFEQRKAVAPSRSKEAGRSGCK